MAYNELLGAEVLRGDRDAVRELLRSHPLQASREAILKRGYFADAGEFDFAVADEFARLVLQDPADQGWGDLLKLPPRWTTDAERLQEVQAFGQAAVGLHLLRTGKTEEARPALIEAGRQRLGTLQERYRKSVYASPLPHWTDQLLLEFAIAATLSSGGMPDYDLLLGAHVVLSRSVETSADDALASQSIQVSDEKRRIAQSVRTIAYQRADWEKTELAALAARLSSPDKRGRETIDQERLRILRTANDFAVQQRRLHAALIDANTSGGVDSVTSLANLKPLLLDDEALVFYVPAQGRLGKICVRADRAQSATQQLDATTATADARLLRTALAATHPASIEADSRFPAVEAVRLGKLLFGGLEECLRSSRRIYHVTGALAGQVPPAALLAEVPPVLGSGYDLRRARWLIRDHSFVRTSSIDAFVATKRLSRTRRATLDYLGVGDPVLSPPAAPLPSGGLVAVRDGLNALPQLPETSEEVERVASLFARAKVRLLRREAATEEAFRLEPLSEFDVVHFATHGLVRQELPGLREPSLVFTPDPRGDAFNDGLLTASQIAALPLRARLVILSACNSARYDPSIIDIGIQGLATSFAIAGVPSMIAALWPVESALTRDLIVDVFRTARGGGGVAVADALAVAMRRHLDGPAPRPLLHPRFWAALVVLGDGSITLDGEANAGPRDLGPFAAINPSQDEEILSAAPLEDDFVTSTIGAWNGKRSPSLIRRQAIDGTKKWEVADPEIGAGPIAASTQAIYAGGYLSFPKGASIVSAPILRALRPDGTVAWSHRLASGPRTTMVMGLAVASDQSALALVGPTFGQEGGTDFSLRRVDTAGTEVGRMDISMQGNGQSQHSGYLGVDGTSGLAVINREFAAKVRRRSLHPERAWPVRVVLGRRRRRTCPSRHTGAHGTDTPADRPLPGQQRAGREGRLDRGGRHKGRLPSRQACRGLRRRQRRLGRATVARRVALRHIRSRHPEKRRRHRDRRLRPAIDRRSRAGTGHDDAGFQQETRGQRGLRLGRGLFRSLVRTGGRGTAGLRGCRIADHGHGHGLGGRAQRDLRDGRIEAALDEALSHFRQLTSCRAAGLQVAGNPRRCAAASKAPNRPSSSRDVADLVEGDADAPAAACHLVILAVVEACRQAEGDGHRPAGRDILPRHERAARRRQGRGTVDGGSRQSVGAVVAGAGYVDTDDNALADIHRAMSVAGNALVAHLVERTHAGSWVGWTVERLRHRTRRQRA